MVAWSLFAAGGGVVVVFVVLLASFSWGPPPSPCCAPAGCVPAASSCGPVTPAPTTFLASGTTFEVPAAGFSSFSIELSPATYALVSGAFNATSRVAVMFMAPSSFANFSAAPSAFACTGVGCVTTNATTGTPFEFHLQDRSSTAYPPFDTVPWYLVQYDPSSTTAATVTWTADVVAEYYVVSG